MLSLLILGLAVRIFLLSTDRIRLIESFFFDDSYYLLNIARNIAAGNGITHDGLHMTNGFQPLYVLALIPVYWITGLNRIYPVYFAAIFLSVCGVISAYLCYKIVEKLFNRDAANFSLLLTLFSPIALRYSLNGAETSLAIMLFLAITYLYINRFQHVSFSEISTRQVILLGALIGLGILARIDMLIPAFVICAEIMCVHLRRAAELKGLVKKFPVLILTVLIVISPWCIYNVAYFNSFIPLSGKAVRIVADTITVRNWELADPSFFLSSLFRSNEGFLFYGTLTGKAYHVLRSFALLPDWLGFYWSLLSGYVRGTSVAESSARAFPGFAALVSIVGFSVILYLWCLREKKSENMRQFLNGLKRSCFLIVFSLILVCAYIWKVCAWWHFQRYFAPVFYIIAIFLSLSVFIVFDLFPPRIKWAKYATISIMVCSLLFLFLKKSQDYIYAKGYWKGIYTDVIPYIEQNFRENDTFGAFQSGFFSYFLDLKVHNLDGVVNPKALVALEQNRLDSYVWAEGIDYLVDWDFLIMSFLDPHHKLKSELTRVRYFPDCMMVIYKINHLQNE